MDRRQFILSTAALCGCSGNSEISGTDMGGSRGIVPTGGIPGASGQFFADPYSAYPTRLVDGTIASDVAGGTALTRTWNNTSASYQVYKTISFGISDWLAGGSGRRLGLMQQTYSQSAALVLPNAGTSDIARCIIQGDPAAVASAIPKIPFSGGFGFTIGNDNNGLTNTAPYVTFRKLDISTDNITSVSPVNAGPDHDYSGLVIEYCAIHDAIEFGGDNVGAIRVDGAVTGPTAIIRYCKLYNITTDGIVGRNLNCSCVDSFSADTVQVYNCLMYNANNGVFVKRPGAANPNGWTIRNNIIRNVANGVWLSHSGANDVNPHRTPLIYQNLIYTLDVTGNALEVDGNSCTLQSTGLQFYQNTIAEDDQGGCDIGNMTSAQLHSNVFLSSASHIQTHVDSAATSLTTCDYNRFLAIGAAHEWELQRNGSSPPPVSFTSLASWQAAHTNNPTYGDLTADPDAHSAVCVLTDFPNRAARDYTYANGVGQGQGGINIGYDPTNIGPGW